MPHTSTTATTRGVVVCPSITISDRNVALNAGLSSQDLRRYLLYWDRIAYAYPNGFGKPNLDALQDLAYLEQEGLLSLHDTHVTTLDIGTPEVPSPQHLSEASDALFTNQEPTEQNPTGLVVLGTPMSAWRDMIYFAPHRAAQELERGHNSLWSVAQTSSDYVFAGGAPRNAAVLEAVLLGALPVPCEDVPLDDILEFRLARQSELLRLRHAIDQLRDRALRAEDTHRAFATSRDELAIALHELRRALAAQHTRVFFSTLKLYLDLSDNKLATTLIAAIGASGLGFPLEMGAAVGLGVSTALTFAARLVNRPPPLPGELRDFLYLYDVHRHWPSHDRSGR